MVSVCMATYNGSLYIEEQIKSILEQLDKDDEIIVCDDQSTDNTPPLIKQLNDTRIILVQLKHSGSPIKVFEEALKRVRGKYIFLSDQDDVWLPGKVRTCLKQLQSADCVVTDCQVTDKQLNITASSFYQINRTRPGFWYNLLIKNGYLGCCMAFKKEMLAHILPFPPQIPMHDIWIGNRCALSGKVVFEPRPLLLFRRHKHNTSNTAAKSPFSLYKKLLFRWKMCSLLFRVYCKQK